MTCIWNGNLQGQSVDRSNRHSQKQFLYPDHWIQPKSREHDKHIWFVVRLRFGPVVESLNSLIDLLWRTIAASHTALWTAKSHSNTITLLPLNMHVHMVYANRSMDTPTNSWSSVWIHWAPFEPIPAVNFNCQYKPQMKMYIVSFHDSTHPTYFKKVFHYGCYSLWAICQRIFHMKGSSYSTPILDGRLQSSNLQ